MRWRSGVEPSGPEHLTIDGVYRRSRNPMFILVMGGQAGLFLALPSAFTLIFLILGVAAIHARSGSRSAT